MKELQPYSHPSCEAPSVYVCPSYYKMDELNIHACSQINYRNYFIGVNFSTISMSDVAATCTLWLCGLCA